MEKNDECIRYGVAAGIGACAGVYVATACNPVGWGLIGTGLISGGIGGVANCVK